MTAERWVRTVEDARVFVRSAGLCLIFKASGAERGGRYPALWDVVDAPDKRPGEHGFGERDALVWRLKNELPLSYPDEVYYGKLAGGRAMLCTLERLTELYRAQYREAGTLSRDAQRLLALIAGRPISNKDLRLDSGLHTPEARSRFERALQELQVSFQIARVDVEPDTWFPFAAVYPAIAARSVTPAPAARSPRA
ncbi:MAG TPA: hypothetical protein VFI42_00320 [Thermomicrobiaceae bacterium]|nr:hypothetical protein [Thermomicrobiaceae bacterium]